MDACVSREPGRMTVARRSVGEVLVATCNWFSDRESEQGQIDEPNAALRRTHFRRPTHERRLRRPAHIFDTLLQRPDAFALTIIHLHAEFVSPRCFCHSAGRDVPATRRPISCISSAVFCMVAASAKSSRQRSACSYATSALGRWLQLTNAIGALADFSSPEDRATHLSPPAQSPVYQTGRLHTAAP